MSKTPSEVIFRLKKFKLSRFQNDLDLSNSNMTEFPMEIFGLSNLHYLLNLDLSGNLIKEIPDEISRLKNMENLTLNSNNITSISKKIKLLSKLIYLDLGSNYIRVIPSEFEWPEKLVTLDMSNNLITEFSGSLSKLQHLECLLLFQNKLRTLSKSIGNLTELIYLDLSDNDLAEVPETLLELKKISYLYVEGNDIGVSREVFELSALDQIQAIIRWQNAKKEGTLEPIHEAKAIFIGESNYGKTHLIEYLKKGEIKREIKTTHGIERSQIAIPRTDKDIRINIWDLGGQEFMRSTHQFFFSERTLYVLVTLARRERKELNHWLNLANQLGDRAPVLVVINKIDRDDHDLDRKSLERDYPNIVGFVRTTIKDCDAITAEQSIQNLKNEIFKVIRDQELMPSVFEQRPPDWFTVKQELEKLESQGKHYISYDDYENLKHIKDLPEVDRKSNLKLLSMIGAVISFVDDPRLMDTNVINPQWILDGVYAIINDKQVKDDNKGKLHITDLNRILPKRKFPNSRHGYLLELMKKFGLCYATKDDSDIYFIPDLFEDVEPEFPDASECDGDEIIHFRFNYDDFPPDSFITRFIVEMHQDIHRDMRWRSGVYISNGTCHAKVYQSFRKNYIHVEVKGNKGEGRSYLYTIRESFRKLHKPFPKMVIKQEVKYKDHWIDYKNLMKFEKKNRVWYHPDLDEDLPVTDILNGYSTLIERENKQKSVKLFLASSNELEQEREKFQGFINRENDQLYKKGYRIELIIWENYQDSMSQSRLQEEYNRSIRQSDIFVSLFFSKVGKFTEEEFDTAYEQFRNYEKPLIYTYFKNAPVNSGDINEDTLSLVKFKKKLKELGHYPTMYKSTEDLFYQFKNQLEKILPTL